MTASTEHHDTAHEPRIDPVTGEDVIALEADAPGNGWDRERHCATDLRGADWLARKWRDAQGQIALNEEMGQAEVEIYKRKIIETEARIVEANQPFRRTVAFCWDALAVFMETHRDEVLKGLKSGTKSRLLPSGVRIGWKSREGGYRWDPTKTDTQNRSALMPFALSRGLTKPGPVQIDLEAVKAELAALHDPEQPRFTPPGLEYVPPGETLSVTTKGESK